MTFLAPYFTNYLGKYTIKILFRQICGQFVKKSIIFNNERHTMVFDWSVNLNFFKYVFYLFFRTTSF